MQQQVARPKTREMQLVEFERGRQIEDLLHELYIERGLTVEKIGTDLGITAGSVSRWLERLGIPPRRRGPRRKVA